MSKKNDPLFSRNVVEFTAAAAEFCKYAEHAREIKGGEMLRILQRILPFIYLKASLLPDLQPYFDDGNEKFVNEADWSRVKNDMRLILASSDDYLGQTDGHLTEIPDDETSSISEDMADIYQYLKDFLLLYQTGTQEVMNDAVWECRLNFENIWGIKLLSSIRAIHKFIYSGNEIEALSEDDHAGDEERNTRDWIISKRQKDFRKDDE
jgi:hypothetical protein